MAARVAAVPATERGRPEEGGREGGLFRLREEEEAPEDPAKPPPPPSRPRSERLAAAWGHGERRVEGRRRPLWTRVFAPQRHALE